MGQCIIARRGGGKTATMTLRLANASGGFYVLVNGEKYYATAEAKAFQISVPATAAQFYANAFGEPGGDVSVIAHLKNYKLLNITGNCTLTGS